MTSGLLTTTDWLNSLVLFAARFTLTMPPLPSLFQITGLRGFCADMVWG
ncbi:hypothetical protein BN2364_2519 [Alloalcanivorax xenomutans]|nr:hypothetical protein BN2364_2519 [Alloalcanivorax xenomutans]